MDMQQWSTSSHNQVLNFVDKLIEQRKFSDLTPELREQLQKDAVEQLNSFILSRVLETLSNEDAMTIATMIQEKQSPETLRQFAVDHIPDYPTFMSNVLQEFEQRYLE